MKLAFSATFPSTQLDTNVWDTCSVWFNPATGCTNFGNPQEEEWYLPGQDQVSDGVLHLVATETPTLGTDSSGAPKTYPYTSGMVTTLSVFSVHLRLRANLPYHTCGPDMPLFRWVAVQNTWSFAKLTSWRIGVRRTHMLEHRPLGCFFARPPAAVDAGDIAYRPHQRVAHVRPRLGTWLSHVVPRRQGGRHLHGKQRAEPGDVLDR